MSNPAAPTASVPRADRQFTKQEIAEAAAELYRLNKAANAAKQAYDKARAQLLHMMDAKKMETLSPIKTEDLPLLQAVVETPVTESIDPVAFRALVTDDVFMQVVSITKTAAAKAASADIIAQTVKTKDGTRNVTVSTIK